MFDVKRFNAGIDAMGKDGIFAERKVDYTIYDDDLLMNLGGIESGSLTLVEWNNVALRMFVFTFATYDGADDRVSFLVSARDKDTALLLAYSELLAIDFDDIRFDPVDCIEIGANASCYFLRQDKLIDAPGRKLQSIQAFLKQEAELSG